MDFLHVRLDASASSLPAIASFYGGELGITLSQESPALVVLEVGVTRLEFRASQDEPFYHFALLAPGNRGREVVEWARERAELLRDPESGDVAFDFTNWAATACYFHDPAGNIVELIAHRGLGETKRKAPFAPGELLGLSELGLVGDPEAMAEALERRLGLQLWDGTVSGERRLAFVGERGRTLILCPVGRVWLPTRRPAKAHPAEAVLTPPPVGEALVNGYRIRR